MKQKWKRCMGLLACIMMLCGSLTVNAEDEQIKISDKEYLVSLLDANSIFISNDKAVSGEVGSKVFLTYTVESVTKNNLTQNGVVGTMDHTEGYPYSKNGRLDYVSKSVLFEEGYTYVYRFERTEQGYAYQCAKLKGDKSVNINFSSVAQNGDSDAYKYYGIWCDGVGDAGITAMLNHVRCYDEKGNDLGVHFNRSTGMIQNEANAKLDVHLTIDTKYSFEIEKLDTLAISNKYPTKSDTVYMEYEVSDVKDDYTIQQGVIVTKAPDEIYPFSGGKGQLSFKSYEKEETNKPLLRNGAKYFICFSKNAEGYDAIIQCTQNGVTETFSFPWQTGTYNKDFQYFSLWFGDGVESTFSAKFKNFKCYDDKGNSLGVQMRKKNVAIHMSGETEDYSKSKAVYYCKDNNEFIILSDDNKAIKQIGDTKEQATYKILNRNELYLTFADGKETYNYTSLLIKDEKENVYKRMKDSTVTFVTGEEVKEVQVDAASGYRVSEPEVPTMKDNTFKGWYLSDDTAFDFDTVVTESVTLYAKWEDGDGNEYLAQIFQDGVVDSSMIIAIAGSVVLLAGCASGCVILIRKGKKHGRN